MKTRFSSLVTLKKSAMDKSERVVQSANADLNSASIALKNAYNSLDEIQSPQSGTISQLIASRTLFGSQRNIIEHNKKWVDFATKQVEIAKEKLKKDMIEHEKFKHLELVEIKKIIKQKNIQEAKDLDEIALMIHGRKD